MLSKDHKALLKQFEFDDATATAVSGDADNRQYWRLTKNDQSKILMYWSPKTFWPQTPSSGYMEKFADLADYLTAAGLSAPEIYGMDVVKKLIFLEDFGDTLYFNALEKDKSLEPQLYTLAVEALIHLHRFYDKEPIKGIDKASNKIWFFTLNRFIDHYFINVIGNRLPVEAVIEYQRLWGEVLDQTIAMPQTLCLLDYHSPNLMYLKGRKGVKQVGVLDFQDALIAPPMVDLSLLLFDPRRDVPEDLQEKLIAQYANAFPKLSKDTLRDGLDIFIAWKNMALLGQFISLAVNANKPGYLKHLPRCWQRLEKALQNKKLKHVKKWFDKYVPEDKRILPPHLKDKIA